MVFIPRRCRPDYRCMDIREAIDETWNNYQRVIDRPYIEEVSKRYRQSRKEAKEAGCCEILFADGKEVGTDGLNDDSQAGGNHNARHQ